VLSRFGTFRTTLPAVAAERLLFDFFADVVDLTLEDLLVESEACDAGASTVSSSAIS
jgi:hypothetical protein